MKKYETYKNSGVEWIGEVPENWKTMRFKHFVDQITTPSTHPHKIALENIESKTGKFVSTDSEFEGNGVAFNVDDIVYGRLRPYLQKVWKAEFEGNAIGDFFVYRVKDNCLPSYLKYVMLSDNFTSAANGSTYGAKMPRVASEFIANSVWFLPSLSEQQAIASYLDYKVGQIDASVSAINSQIDDLKSYRQSIISEAVTKGLNPNVPMKDSGVEWIGEIPEEWETLILKRIAHVLTGTTPSTAEEKYWNNPNYTWYTPSDIKEDSIKLDDSERKVNSCAVSEGAIKEFPSGSLLMVGIGSIGKVGITYKPCSANQQINAIVFNSSVNPRFGAYFIFASRDNIRSKANAALLAIINQTTMGEVEFVLPPIETQNAIVEFLDTKISKIESAITSLEAQRDDLNTLKQSIISEAVTGKIDIRDWKPNK